MFSSPVGPIYKISRIILLRTYEIAKLKLIPQRITLPLVLIPQHVSDILVYPKILRQGL